MNRAVLLVVNVIGERMLSLRGAGNAVLCQRRAALRHHGRSRAHLRGGIHDHCKVFAKYSPEPKYTIPKAEVKAAIKESARRLGKSRHDCILLEWSDFQVNGWVEVAQHMAALKSEGLARAVGVVNFGLEQVRELVRRSRCEHRPQAAGADAHYVTP